MTDAPAVHQPFDIVAWGGEGLGHPFVGEQHRSVCGEGCPQSGEHLAWPGEVVQGLEDEDEVVGAHDLTGVRRVPEIEGDAVTETGLRGVLPGGGDGRGVNVVAVDGGLREGSCQGEGGPALAAADVGDPGDRVGTQPRGQVRHRVQPAGEVVDEHGPVHAGLPAAEGRPVGGVRDSASVAVGLRKVGQHAADPGHHVGQRGHVRRVVRVEEHRPVPGRDGVAAMLGGRCRAVAGDLQQAGDRLLLQPLPGVPGGDARPFGQPRIGHRRPGQCLVQPELTAEMDAEQLEGRGAGGDQTSSKRVATAVLVRCRAPGQMGVQVAVRG